MVHADDDHINAPNENAPDEIAPEDNAPDGGEYRADLGDGRQLVALWRRDAIAAADAAEEERGPGVVAVAYWPEGLSASVDGGRPSLEAARVLLGDAAVADGLLAATLGGPRGASSVSALVHALTMGTAAAAAAPEVPATICGALCGAVMVGLPCDRPGAEPLDALGATGNVAYLEAGCLEGLIGGLAVALSAGPGAVVARWSAGGAAGVIVATGRPVPRRLAAEVCRATAAGRGAPAWLAAAADALGAAGCPPGYSLVTFR